jgi:hypothetical protein
MTMNLAETRNPKFPLPASGLVGGCRALAVLLLGMVTSAGAQDLDARWAPFAGCWELVQGGATTCVAPASAGAVTLTTLVDGKTVLEQTIIADGMPHAFTEAGCAGSQRSEWSRDGRKLFTRGELTCATQPRRTISGLALMTGDHGWLDVQAVEIAGNTSLRLRRFRRADGTDPRPATSIAPYAGAATFTLEDVKEAHARVAPAVLEAALAEIGARFALSARELVGLDDAGVPGAVIDLMIAMSYPERFQVERRGPSSVDAYRTTFGQGAWNGYWGLGYPYLYSYPGFDADYGDYYSPYGYSPYGYSPYGYAYPGSYYYYPYPGLIQAGGADGGTSASRDGNGRVVNGVGYTRVRTREAAPRSGSGGNSSSGSSSARGSSGGRATMTSSGATQSGGDSSSSGGASSSGGGSSSGSGESDSGRTAQPR